MDYQHGKVYRVDCLTTGEVYIGSTCQPTIAKRLACHVYCFKQWKKTGKGFITSYPIIERGNYQITLIESVQCNSKDELRAREGFYIRTLDCVNKNIAGRPEAEYRAEYRETHKEEISEKNKQWYIENKEEISERRKGYYEVNKEKVLEKNKEWAEANKTEISERRKGYYEVNKEVILEKNKEWVKSNRDKINARKRELYKLKKQQDLTRKTIYIV